MVSLASLSEWSSGYVAVQWAFDAKNNLQDIDWCEVWIYTYIYPLELEEKYLLVHFESYK